MDDNPYDPPPDLNEQGPSTLATRNRGRGPALYIVGGGLIAALLAAPFHSHLNPIGLALAPVGTLAGGLLYRLRSRAWPIDPTARRRQLLLSVAVVCLIPAVIAALMGFDNSGIGSIIIGLIVGICIAAGILASGTHRRTQES